ncbi:MAG: hypothetical protein AAFX77_13280 [Pseudomonadota bacterium]
MDLDPRFDLYEVTFVTPVEEGRRIVGQLKGFKGLRSNFDGSFTAWSHLAPISRYTKRAYQKQSKQDANGKQEDF